VLSLIGAIQDLLFPPVCVVCGQRLAHSQPPLFCDHCLGELAFINSPLCPCCGLAYNGGDDHLCGACLRQQYSFDRARSLLVYTPAVAPLILRLKFSGQLSALSSLGALTARSPSLDDLSEPDWIIPVPLYRKRLRQRGYNQATLIAQACFPQWRHKIRHNLLTRPQPTRPQTQLTGRARRTNLAHAFALVKEKDITGRDILLVDDVLTTGSTVNECAKTLRRGGARRIEIYTVARSWPEARRALLKEEPAPSDHEDRRGEPGALIGAADYQVR
jgi:ComF family protein